MDVAVLFARIGLAVVLIVAGVAKLLDRDSTRVAIPGFGIPDFLARPIAIALPIVEFGVGIALIPAGIARLAAVAATLLFASFSIVVGLALIRGRRPECHCFGQLSSGAITAATLGRSSVLAVAAAFVVFGWVEPPLTVVGWVEGLSSGRALLLAGSVLALAVFGAVRGRRYARQPAPGRDGPDGAPSPMSSDPASAPAGPPRGLPLGTPAPPFAFVRPDGTPGTSDEFFRGRTPVLLVFMNPGCFACEYLRPHVSRWDRNDADSFTVVVVSTGDLERNRRMRDDMGVERFVVQDGYEVDALYEVPGTPSAVLVGTDGAIASSLKVSALEIKALVASIGGSAAPPEERGRRDRAPSPAGG